MPRPRRSNKVIADDSEEEEEVVEAEDDGEEEQGGDEDDGVVAPTKKKKGRSSSKSRRRRGLDDDEAEEEVDDAVDTDTDPSSAPRSQGMFTSQVAESTQNIHEVKDSELRNLLDLQPEMQEKVARDLFRAVLFRAHQMESVDRAKCVKEAGIAKHRVSSAAFKEVEAHLQNLFGYGLRRVPPFMEKMKGLPAAVKDKYYVINLVEDDTGEHSRALHTVHDACMIEKALLMLVLGLAYCKGNPKHDGSRWIHDKDLYYYLHAFDENIPAEPPTTGGRVVRKRAFTPSSQVGASALAQSPDVDALLEKFVKREHLVRAKATEDQVLADAKVEPESCFYAMGPRSALEVGRKQVVYFCADVLGVKPDAAMLKEIEADDNEDEGLQHG